MINIIYIDKLDKYIRTNISYESKKGIFLKIRDEYLKKVDGA